MLSNRFFGHSGRGSGTQLVLVLYFCSAIHIMKRQVGFFSMLFSIFWVGSAPLFAQLATDFTVTDTAGDTHSLYADYLNQDQVVVLGLFYEGAPMVETLFPALQNYAIAEWANQTPVRFLLLSGIDPHTSLALFAENHSLILPVSGYDGGAPAAITQFTNGSFGPFYGYPMFVVIGPQGDVIFDPWGSDAADIIATIDLAVKSFIGNVATVEAIGAANSPLRVNQLAGQIEVCIDQSAQAEMQLYNAIGQQLEVFRLTAGCQTLTPKSKGHLIYGVSGDVAGRGQLFLH